VNDVFTKYFPNIQSIIAILTPFFYLFTCLQSNVLFVTVGVVQQGVGVGVGVKAIVYDSPSPTLTPTLTLNP
jgi:hypothetical protein